MTKPYYQDISSTKIPIVQLPGEKGRVKVIAGKFNDTNSIINTKIPILYLHIILETGAKVKVPVNNEYNTFVYVLSGEGIFDENGTEIVKKGQMAIFNKDVRNIWCIYI